MTRISTYESRRKLFADLQADLVAESDKLSNYRLAVFVLGLVLGAIASVGVSSSSTMAVLFLFSILCFVGFGVLVIKHRRVAKEENRNRVLKELNEQAIHRLGRDWDEFPVPKSPEQYRNLPTARDLDVFGKASLFQLLSVQRTPQGRAKLAEWLIEPAAPTDIVDRQKAAAALSEHLDWRQNLAEIGENLAVDEAEIIPQWLDKEEWLSQQDRLSKYLVFAPWVTLFSLVLMLLFPAVPAIILVAGFHFFLIRKNKNRIAASLRSIAEEDRKIRSYGEVFRYVKKCPEKRGRLAKLLPKFDQACEAMDRFNAIATGAAARGSLVHPVLNGLAAFDLQLVKKLETWQQDYREQFSNWFESLGEIEALACLASLRYDEPDWVWPTFSESGSLETEKIAHPLICQETRVANDISVGPEGRFLLVTGVEHGREKHFAEIARPEHDSGSGGSAGLCGQIGGTSVDHRDQHGGPGFTG